MNIERLNEIAKPRNKKAARKSHIRQNVRIMKELLKSYKFWLVVAIIAAVVIAAVVCHLVQPKVTYAWMEVVSFVTFGLGIVVGWLISKKIGE